MFSTHEGDLGCTKLISHDIPLLDDTPVRQRYRHIPPSDYEAVKAHIQQLLENGIIRESCSPFASPIVIVRKKDSTIRLCVDYRLLNSRTRRMFGSQHYQSLLLYLDDVIVFSNTVDDHVQRVGPVLETLKTENLKVKLEKCCFLRSEVKYLGHVISNHGVATDPDKISAVSEWHATECYRTKIFSWLC